MSKITGPIRYRPTLSTDLHVRVSPALDRQLRNMAAKSNRPVSREVRQALEEYVARENRRRND